MNHTPRNTRPTTRRSSKGLTTLAAALLLALTVGACGDGGSEMTATKKDRTESSSTPSPRDSEPTDEPTEEPTAVPTEEPGEPADGTPLAELVEETQGFVAQQLEQFSDTYSDMTVTGSGTDTIVYSYTYAKRADATSTAQAIEAQVGSLQSTLDAQVFPAMREAGIASPKATYIYKNTDGSVIWEKTFSPS